MALTKIFGIKVQFLILKITLSVREEPLKLLMLDIECIKKRGLEVMKEEIMKVIVINMMNGCLFILRESSLSSQKPQSNIMKILVILMMIWIFNILVKMATLESLLFQGIESANLNYLFT